MLVLGCVLSAQAQNVDAPDVACAHIADHAAAPEAFVPIGWRLEHQVRGRLDAYDSGDALLLLRMDAPANIIDNDGFGQDHFDTNPCMLIALLSDRGGS